ncbi:AP-5 complex subunit zeta-1 isoform X3 [Balaenoptera acutorostrata]|uniref:AP-5 complex subunit zeta-1 isoform X3 n=1 Tax=Balaenoptera acutorostrata TaxID=9767 RepID=A0ABM3S3F0_BALAC|nr:AP-5 complex subunit zeta-1 isoform X3 [Balaenoptera acutorostrata]
MRHGTLHVTRPGSRRCCGLFSRSRQRADCEACSPDCGGGGGGGSGGGGSGGSGRMFTTGAESLLLQAREIRDEELGKLCTRVCALLRKEDWGSDALDALRRLFLIVSATKYSRRLEKPCVALLQTTLCSPTCPEQLQLLCAAVLREMSPSDSLSLSCDHIQNTRQLGLVASVLLAQGDQQQVRSLGQRVLKVLESRQPEGPSLRHLLPVVSKVTSLAPDALHEEQTRALSKRLGDWLRYASVQQGVAHSSGGFFSTPRARQLGPVTEVDGAVATDFFTVLSTGQRFTEDQWLNVQAFSMLRAWLLDSEPGGSGAPDADDKSELEGSTRSVLSATSTASHLLPPQEWLREKAFEYCQRLLEQSNRRALRKADSDLQKACLVEAVLVLDVLCRQDPSFLYRTLSCLKALHTRLRGDPAWVRALLPVAQFFLHHGEAAAVDAEAVYQHLFTRIPAEHFHSPMLAFEFVQFCRDSLPLFGRNLGVLRTSFPNLFKFLAWNSPPLTSDFVALLPSLVDAGTAVEMLHLLLDLPCLTAALDLQLRSLQAASERPPWDISIRAPGCLEAFRDSQVHGLFQHLLRAQASGTAERLTPLYRLLQPLAGCARVVQCAEAVPTLLQAFFSAVTQFADGTLASQLALLLLERSDSLYQVPGYEAGVHRVLSSQFPALCKLHPPLVVEHAKELLEFVGGPRGGGHVLTSVVWAIGEYLSVSWDRRCTVEQINNFFEALEALLFEVTQSRPSTTLPKCPPQVITVLMTTLTKLASRSQDLIPRVSLLLSKMRSLAQSPATGSMPGEEDVGAIRTRATELLNLLKMPSVAQFVFTPSVEVSEPRYHRDTNTALPLVLRTSARRALSTRSLPARSGARRSSPFPGAPALPCGNSALPEAQCLGHTFRPLVPPRDPFPRKGCICSCLAGTLSSPESLFLSKRRTPAQNPGRRTRPNLPKTPSREVPAPAATVTPTRPCARSGGPPTRVKQWPPGGHQPGRRLRAWDRPAWY